MTVNQVANFVRGVVAALRRIKHVLLLADLSNQEVFQLQRKVGVIRDSRTKTHFRGVMIGLGRRHGATMVDPGVYMNRG